MRTLTDWTLEERLSSGVSLRIDGCHLMHITVAEESLFHIVLLRDGEFRLDRTWCISPDQKAPWEGRHRLDPTGFPCPGFSLCEVRAELTIETAVLRLRIRHPLQLIWEVRVDDTWRPLAADRPTGAYMLGARDHRHGHFLTLAAGDRIFGLGEKSGLLERTGRRFEMRNLDALGYDAKTTDPLYKHVPFTVTKTPEAGSYGLFYDNLASCWFDLGNEIDNYHPRFRSYRAEDGDLDYWFSWAPDITGCTKTQLRITGGTAFPPRWSLGYSGSTMAYTDAPDAQTQLEGFLDKLVQHQIPCDSFQLSSGYSSIGNKRYVFTWNRTKIPDPVDLARRFSKAGVRLIGNVKPVLLRDHPKFAEAAEAGLFVKEPNQNAPASMMFWGDRGAHLDFTNPDTVDWWKQHLTTQLLYYGIAASWNDNNECELWDSTARANGFGSTIDVGLIRPLMSLLMTRASAEAQAAHAPEVRPFLISRSGCPGMQRYAQTWTGDNYTSWDTLRWNIRMGLGLSLSGIYNIGHDVGGFAGPPPGPELLLRWVQNGIFHPRFTIHSWNDDSSVTEPWMYPEVTDLIRETIALRYRLLPYLYTLLWRAVSEGEPILRPTFLDHEDDQACFEDTDDFMLGPDLLVANVVEEGARNRHVYLPMNTHGWIDFHSGTWHPGGKTLNVPVTLASIPLFVRAGAILPLSDEPFETAPAASTERRLIMALFPAPGEAETTSWFFEDDGGTSAALNGDYCLAELHLSSDSRTLQLRWNHIGRYRPPQEEVEFVLPIGERRTLLVGGRPLTPGTPTAFFGSNG